MGKSPASLRAQARYAEKLEHRYPLPSDLAPDQVGVAAALYVARYRRDHGTGPSGKELSQYLHGDCSTTCGAQLPHDGHRRLLFTLHGRRLVGQLMQAGWVRGAGRYGLTVGGHGVCATTDK